MEKIYKTRIGRKMASKREIAREKGKKQNNKKNESDKRKGKK